MKKFVGVSLFIFWTIAAAIIVAGLVFYQKNSTAVCAPCNLAGSAQGAATGTQVTLDMKEIAKHNSASDCWLLISNKIYNVTGYVSAHPGGAGTILPYCGKEATVAFQTKDIGRPHSTSASNSLTSYYIGDLNQKIGQQQVQQSIQNTNAITPPAGRGELEDD